MAHSNTIFSQLLQLINRHDFRKIENEGFLPKRKYRSLSRWDQFAAMFFAQLSGKNSLRNITDQFKFHENTLYHLGLSNIKRSTLADANRDRPAEFYESLFNFQYAKTSALCPKHKFRFHNKLYSLDSTTIDLCLSVFPWAKFRKSKAGIKVHTVLDHDGCIPAFIEVTDAKAHDVTVAKTLNLPQSSIVVMDRAYNDYNWFKELTKNKIFFVSRQKQNAKYRVLERNPVIKSSGVTSDQTIEFKNKKIKVRRIGYRDPETGKHYKFFTNHFKLSAKTIADIYKDRWQVETFFKWIKQNLKIKTFLGTSRNAVMTQIWIALIAKLMLVYLKHKAKLGNSPSKLLQLLQSNLFEKRSIWSLYEKYKPKITYDKNQLTFNFKSL